MLKEEIQQLAKEYLDKTIVNCRYLHAHPELSFKEDKTAGFVIGKLEKLNIPYERKAWNGIVVVLKGTHSDSDRVVPLRADMDALNESCFL